MGGDELNLAEALRLATVPHYAGFDTVREEIVYAPSDGSGGGGVAYRPIVLGTPLDIDSSYSASATVHIPIQYAGTYTIYVVTDATDSIYEGIYEFNNETASQQTIEVVMSPLSDLTVTSVTMPATVSPRCNYPVSWTVQNGGAGATERAFWRDALYLSPTPTYNSSTAIFLKNVDHTGVIGIDSSYTDSTNITIPATLTGSHYLIVRTDSQDNIFEYTNEDNNERASTAPAQVVLPDLVVSSAQFESSCAVGDTLHVRAYIKNIGQNPFEVAHSPLKGIDLNVIPAWHLTDSENNLISGTLKVKLDSSPEGVAPSTFKVREVRLLKDGYIRMNKKELEELKHLEDK